MILRRVTALIKSGQTENPGMEDMKFGIAFSGKKVKIQRK